ILGNEDCTIALNGVHFKSIVHIRLQNDRLMMSGLPCKKNIDDYRSYYWLSMKENVEQFSRHIDYASTDQLLAIKQQEQTKIVKVLLATALLDQRGSTEWVLDAEKPMSLHKKDNESTQGSTCAQKISIVVGNGKILVNGCLTKSSIVYIESQETFIQFNKKKYKGSFIVIRDEKKVFLINSIDLEEYIYAVVRSESWPGWPLEVNKVFAISCRSYALHLITGARRTKRFYHIKDTNVHQRYNLYGEHQNATVRRAVEETKGVCLTYKNMPVLAMFDSCCGGIIPAHTKSFHFTDETLYLAREYPCTFCKKTSFYSWKATYDLATFEKMIAKHALHVSPLKKIHVHSADKAGVVKELLLEGHKQSIKLSAKWLSTVAKEIKSCLFSVKFDGKRLTFHGTGLGHLVGLCQWGAWQMVSEGWCYKSILRYYYPGTTLKRLL
ncbi:MAG TPA: SpoIID/LytB domain-containing protein, partial [Patescibacteria group bacterium]|nr:SpoIID/LytB domain-containing protein [Patescibacteria group bacterium]